jgi:predicted phosphoribosyltransferase
VYALPRGGVPLGVEVAKALHMPLDLIIPRKIGHPSNPEYAICAVGESGALVCNEAEVSRVDQEWFQQQVQAEREEARRRRAHYLKHRASVPLKGKTAIIVDDGIATGFTMEAAIQDARQQRPGRVVVAVPVVPRYTMDRLRNEVDEVVTLDIPEVYLGAVGAYYDDFAQVSDEEVIDMLQR